MISMILLTPLNYAYLLIQLLVLKPCSLEKKFSQWGCHITVIVIQETYDFSGDFSSLSSELEAAINEPINLGRIKIFLYEFIFDYLCFGHFHDKDLKLDPKFF